MLRYTNSCSHLLHSFLHATTLTLSSLEHKFTILKSDAESRGTHDITLQQQSYQVNKLEVQEKHRADQEVLIIPMLLSCNKLAFPAKFTDRNHYRVSSRPEPERRDADVAGEEHSEGDVRGADHGQISEL